MNKSLILLLILFAGCSDKNTALKYRYLRTYYEGITSSIDYVIEDQQSVFTEGLVTNTEVDPPTFRTATQEDKSKAYEVGLKAITLKDFTDKIIENCKKIEELSSKKRLFKSKDDWLMIDLYKEYIRNEVKSMLEVTDGKKILYFLDPYLTITMRNSMDDYNQIMLRLLNDLFKNDIKTQSIF